MNNNPKSVLLIGVAPSLARFLRIPRPKDSQGRIIHEIME